MSIKITETGSPTEMVANILALLLLPIAVAGFWWWCKFVWGWFH